MRLIDDLKRHEGFEERPYRDSLGVWTFGYGFTYINKDEAEYILRLRILYLRQHLRDKISNLSRKRQDVLVNMAYNLGLSGLMNFTKMWSAIRRQDFDAAADEMLDSRWAQQVGSRAVELAQKMRGNNAAT